MSTKNLKQLVSINRKIGAGITKTTGDFFEKILDESLDKYKAIELTQEEHKELLQFFTISKFGSGLFSPIICKSSDCGYCTMCPLYKMGKAPAANQCPLEMTTIMNSAQKWSEVFERRGLSLEDPIYLHYVSLLTYVDLLLQRCAWAESCGYQSPVIETTAKVGQKGEMFKTIMENPILSSTEKLLKMQESIMESLVLTPREDYKRRAALKMKDDFTDAATLLLKKRQAVKEKTLNEDTVMELPEHVTDNNDTADGGV